MHSTNLYPAGVGVELHGLEDGQYLKSEVVEPTAKLLVKKGVLRAYSVGISRPKIVHDLKARGGRVVDGVFSEVSLVDRPANANCKFDLVKRRKDDFKGEWFTDSGTERSLEVVNQLHGDWADTFSDIEEVTKGAKCPNCGASVPDDVEKCPKCATPVLTKTESEEELLKVAAAAALWYMDQDLLLGKRNFDTSVGGGTDRDKIPAEDFAGKDRSFPIVTPGDVSDAASSIGRAGSDNYSSDQLKANIIRIARRKGSAFVAELPEAWKDGGEEKELDPDLVKDADGDDDGDSGDDDGGKTCPTCKGKGKIMGGNRTCPDCKGKGKVPPQFAKKLKKVRKAARQAAEMRVVGEVPFAVRKLHDSLCAAYDYDDVVTAYPTLEKNGLATALGPTAKSLLYQMLSNEVQEDAGTGAEAEGIEHIGKAYCSVNKFLNGEAGEAALAQPELLAEARATLHKAFLELNGLKKGLAVGFGDDGSDTGGVPKPSTPPGPGQFKRPYISAGHYRENSSSTSVPMPKTTHVPHPEDFQRPILTAGHEADSPANKDEGADVTKAPARPTTPRASGRTYYTNAARDAATSVMQDLHNHIAQVFPNLCSMGHEENLDGSPSAITDSAGKEIDHMETGPVAHNVSGGEAAAATSAEPKAAAEQPDLVKMADVNDLVKAAVKETTETLTKTFGDQIAELTARLEEFEGQPDPAAAPYRGITLATRAPAGTAEEAVEVRKSAEDEAADEERRFLMSLVNSGNPEFRLRAEARLEKLAATALTK